MASTSDVTSECAVLAFHKTFSQHRRGASLAPRRANTKNLPAELLLVIFKLVYKQQLETRPLWPAIESSVRGPDWIEKDIASTSLFPYAIASVCSLWRDVMSLVPEFWTRVMVLVDSPSILPSAVISWSRDLPIELIVTRKDFEHSVDSQQERTQAVSILKTLINPHIHRIRKLCFKVMFSSSLPPFPTGFDGDPRILSRLGLECKEDDGVSTGVWESLTSAEQQYPSLENLSMDGRIFYHACKKDSKWTAKCASVQHLSVSDFKPNPGESFSSSEFMHPITIMLRLETLFLTNLNLDLDTSPSRPDSWPPSDSLNHITLSHIDVFEPIAEIFGWSSDAWSFTFSHSAIGNPGCIFGDDGGSLSLHDINADQDLIPLLRCWRGEQLHVSECPSFNDAVLTIMATETGDGTAFTCARNVREIDIIDCTNFSMVALRRLISNRVGSESEIATVSIRGKAPPISTRDRRWLGKNLDAFDLDSV